MPRTAQVDDLIKGLGQGDRGALGRAITLVESTRPDDRHAAHELLGRCVPPSGATLRLGVTGIPGVGKSTLIDALGLQLINGGHRVAVLAVDPSSTRTGGSILGDKTRMERLGQHAAAFIRPSPTAGTLGGVARRTREAIMLCEAAGYDRVLIETVGVGQSELEVDRMTDLNLLLMIAGAGDELQGIKRGIMESADAIAITKAAGQDVQRAEHARQDLRNAIHYLPTRTAGRHPDVLLTDALTGMGIAKLDAHIETLFKTDLGSGALHLRRQQQDLHWLHRSVEDGLLDCFNSDPRMVHATKAAEEEVRSGRKSPFQAAMELLDLFKTL